MIAHFDRPVRGRKPRVDLPAGAIDTHCHIFQPGFAAQPGGPDLPPSPPDVNMYRKLMDWLGLSRCVVVQANAHQCDHGNLLAALADLGSAARGIGAVSADVEDDELDALTAAGVVGTRIVGFPGGAVGLEQLEALDARLAPRDWVLVLQFDGMRLPDLEPRLARLKCRFVIDHHGKFKDAAEPGPAPAAALQRLLGGGRCWLKFAGCYESSRIGAPSYQDVAALSRSMACQFPDRITWGSNWPHNLARRIEDYPDDAALLDSVMDWFPDAATRRKALLDTPLQLFGFV